jgi:hypothetical protein
MPLRLSTYGLCTHKLPIPILFQNYFFPWHASCSVINRQARYLLRDPPPSLPERRMPLRQSPSERPFSFLPLTWTRPSLAGSYLFWSPFQPFQAINPFRWEFLTKASIACPANPAPTQLFPLIQHKAAFPSGSDKKTLSVTSALTLSVSPGFLHLPKNPGSIRYQLISPATSPIPNTTMTVTLSPVD